MAINQSWGYGKSKSKIACLLGFSQLSDKPHLYFDRIKPFLASRLISHNGGKKMVKMFSTVSNNWGTHFAGQVIQTLAKSFTSFLETIAFTGNLGCQAGLAKQRDWLHEIRLLNMITIFMTFCLTYCWLLIFVFRYKEALLKLLMV